MAFWQITVGDSRGRRIYQGEYHTAANAAFGTLRFRENELYREARVGTPLSEEYTRRHQAARNRLANAVTVTIEPCGPCPKKVHRVA